MILKFDAISRSGAMVHDVLNVAGKAEALAELARRGLTPVRLDEARSAAAHPLPMWLRRTKAADPRKASRKELPFFTSQLAIMLETGTPLASALDSLAQQVACPHWRRLIGNLHRHVEEGGALASGLAQYPQVFEQLYCSMIAAGETSGNLNPILNRLSRFARAADRLRKKIISALIYPVLLTGIAGAVLTVLIFFVLPRFEGVFTEMEVKLPGSTRFLLGVSHFARNYFFLIVPLLAAALVNLVFWLRRPAGRQFRARMQLRLPIMGPLAASIINGRIFRLMGLLLESNVPLLQAISLTGTSMKNFLYAHALGQMHEQVLNGRSMFEVMRETPRLFSPSLAQMVHTGEENGRLGQVMTLLADYLEDQNDTQVGMLTSIMEPLILIFMGLIIGTVAISLVLPMFDLSRISAH